MHKPLLFPEVKKLHELFSVDRGIPLYGRTGGSRIWRAYQVGCFQFSSYCAVSGMDSHRSIAVKPHASVLEKIADHLVVSGSLYFEIVRRDRTEALVVVRYNHIIGDSWLAIIDGSRLPYDRHPSSLSKQERERPTFRFGLADHIPVSHVPHEVEIRDRWGDVISRSKNLAQLRRHAGKRKVQTIAVENGEKARLLVLFENGDSCETFFGDFDLLLHWATSWRSALGARFIVNGQDAGRIGSVRIPCTRGYEAPRIGVI